MVSGWFGARAVNRDLPPNMREMGDSIEVLYSYPRIGQHRRAQCGVRKNTSTLGAEAGLCALI